MRIRLLGGDELCCVENSGHDDVVRTKGFLSPGDDEVTRWSSSFLSG